MSIGFFVPVISWWFCSFNLAPCAMLLLVPFRDGDYAGASEALYAAGGAFTRLSSAHSLSVWWNMGQAVSISWVQVTEYYRSDEAILNDLYELSIIISKPN